MFTSRSFTIPTSAVALILSAALYIPTSASVASSCGATYTIQAGDSLGKIAQKCEVTVQGIVAANDRIKSPSQVGVGWTIQLPVEEVGSVLPDPPSQPAAITVTELSGRIFNSRSCAQLETDDGKVYGLVGRNVMFRSGQAVTVRGAFAQLTGCSADKVLMVSELETIVN